jgi:hypothetical protein
VPYREMSWWSYRNRGQKIEAIEDSHAGDLAVQRLGPWQPRSLPLRPGRSAWVHVARGAMVAQGAERSEGTVPSGKDAAELLIFDLAEDADEGLENALCVAFYLQRSEQRLAACVVPAVAFATPSAETSNSSSKFRSSAPMYSPGPSFREERSRYSRKRLYAALTPQSAKTRGHSSISKRVKLPLGPTLSRVRLRVDAAALNSIAAFVCPNSDTLCRNVAFPPREVFGPCRRTD